MHIYLQLIYLHINIYIDGTITVAALAVGGGNNDIQVVLQNCAPFT